MTAVLSLLLLLVPVGFHLWNDRRGEKPEEKAGDLILVSALALIAAVVGYYISGKPIIDGLLLAWALHFLIFDYAIVAILKKRGVIETKEHWFRYLGSSYTDDVLRQFTPKERLLLKIGVLVVVVVIYFLK
jgi:hypothetical protein